MPAPEDIKLADLIAHSLSVQTSASLESVANLAREKQVDFLAVMEGDKVIGLCSALKINQCLSARFGHAVYANRDITGFLVSEPVIVRDDTNLHYVLEQVFHRPRENFYDDIIVTDTAGKLAGLIPTDALVRLQHSLLHKQLNKTDEQRKWLSTKNDQLERLTNELEHINSKLIDARNVAEQATKLKSEFLANMSHEIRTPMNGVVGMLTLLSETPLNNDQNTLVGTAEESANALLRIINDILDFSKIEAGKLDIENEAFDLSQLLSSCIMLQKERASSKDIKLSEDFCNLPCELIGDSVRIRQIVNNLVSNAVKFTVEGGVVVSSEIISDRPDNYLIRISIRDTGIGIEAQELSQLFQPFVQADGSTSRSFGGTGLGLSISRKLAKLMGGDIDCISEKGKGSVFRITIPFKKSVTVPIHAVETAPEPVASSTSDGPCCGCSECTRPHVLVAEDNAVNREVARRFLRRVDCETTFAENGTEAIERLRHGTFDMIFMDCQMPVMDGYTATREIRNGAAGDDNKDIFISAMTAHAMQGDRKKCLDAGMDAYISKPMRLAELKEIIEECRVSKQPGLNQEAV